jgi:Flp pilus assembly secretin CpaC
MCLILAGGPAETLSPSVFTPSELRSPSRLIEPGKLVEPRKEPLVIELGRSHVLRFPAAIGRTAVSNADVSDLIQLGPEDVLVLGRKQGVATLTVWLAGSRAVPSVIEVRVERRPTHDE